MSEFLSLLSSQVTIPKRGRPVRKRKKPNLTSQIGRKRFIQEVSNATVMNDAIYDCGRMSSVCDQCEALHFVGEQTKSDHKSQRHYRGCCHNGKVSITLNEVPSSFQNLLNQSSFRKSFRIYNNALSMASLQVKSREFSNRGPQAIVACGQVYHRVSSACPTNENQPKFVQLYFLDSNLANEKRIQSCSSLDRNFLDQCVNILEECNNPYVSSLRNMRDVAVSENANHLRLEFADHPDISARTYARPQVSQIAAVFESPAGEVPTTRLYITYEQSGLCRDIDTTSPHLDPMLYPLVNLYGELGWTTGISQQSTSDNSSARSVTELQYYQYLLAVRGKKSILHQSASLFQQIIIDYFLRIEGSRLKFIRLNQSKLRVDLYKGLQDALNTMAERSNSRIGKMIVLPSTHIGGPRYQQQSFQDALAIVQQHGKPDLFLTFTCNPKWVEITREIGDEQAINRPDIVARVFYLKLQELMRVILDEKWLGDVTAYLYVIEFQKRGMLIIVILPIIY